MQLRRGAVSARAAPPRPLSEPQLHILAGKGSLGLVAVSETGPALSCWPNKETPGQNMHQGPRFRQKQPEDLITCPVPAVRGTKETCTLLIQKRPRGVPPISDLFVSVHTVYDRGTSYPGAQTHRAASQEQRPTGCAKARPQAHGARVQRDVRGSGTEIPTRPFKKRERSQDVPLLPR